MRELTDEDIVAAVTKRVPGAVLADTNERKSILTFYTEGRRDIIMVYRSGRVIIDTSNAFKEGQFVAGEGFVIWAVWLKERGTGNLLDCYHVATEEGSESLEEVAKTVRKKIARTPSMFFTKGVPPEEIVIEPISLATVPGREFLHLLNVIEL